MRTVGRMTHSGTHVHSTSVHLPPEQSETRKKQLTRHVSTRYCLTKKTHPNATSHIGGQHAQRKPKLHSSNLSQNKRTFSPVTTTQRQDGKEAYTLFLIAHDLSSSVLLEAHLPVPLLTRFRSFLLRNLHKLPAAPHHPPNMRNAVMPVPQT